MSLFSTEAMASYMNVESGTRKRFKPDASSQEDKDDDHEEAPKDLKKITKRLERLEMVSTIHEDRIASLEAWATRTWIMAKTEKLAEKVLTAMSDWKEKRPKKGPHPLGPPRNAVALAVAQYFTEDKGAGDIALPIFIEHVQKEVANPAKFGEISMQFAVGRETKPHAKDGEEKKEAKFILQLRAHNLGKAREAWEEVYKVIDEIVEKAADAERLTDKAPPMGASRDIKREVSKRNKGKGKGKAKEEDEEE